MSIIDETIRLFETKGEAAYFGEAVSQLEHALQAAALAESAGASDSLVVAALLHDIGHILHNGSEDLAERGIDDRHENSGAAWLTKHFGPEVTEPIRLHVSAKRYLCTVDPEYHAALSPASQRSLELQGGPFRADERSAFEALAHHGDAVQLRRWDDEAKVPGLTVPGLEHYRACLSAVARESAP